MTNVDPTTTGYADGAANAPAGTPQLPNLLSGYAVRPPWKVAGVDYAVGVPSGTALKDPTIAANLPAGVSINASGHDIYVGANNVTLNGFDFGLHNGWGIVIGSGVSGTVIENCNFLVGSNNVSPIQALGGSSNLTLLNNTFNCGGSSNLGNSLGDALFYEGSGTLTVEYNDFYNTYGHMIDFTGHSVTVTPTVKYNVFEGYGMGAGSHGNPWYMDAGTGTITNGQFNFNTIIQPAGVKGNNPALALPAGESGVTITNTTLENNVALQTASGGITYIFGGAGTANNVIQDNYYDPTGTYGVFDTGTPATNTTITNNIDMVNGSLNATPTGFLTSPVTQDPPPSGPKLNSIIESPSSGDLNAGKTVTLTLNLNEAVTVAGGTPTLTLNDGGTATYEGGSGSNALTFSYTIGAGQNTAALAATAVNLNAATVKNGAGNAANLSLTGLTQSGPQIDTTTPTGSGATRSGSSGATSTGLSGSTLTAPTISSFSADSGKAGGGYTNAHVLTVNGTAAANSKVEAFNGSKQLGTTTVNGSGAWSFTTPTLSDGTQSFTAKDVDAAGKVSPSSAALTVTVVTAATLTKVGNNYDVSATASDPVLKYAGADITAGQFGAWVPIAAVLTASGYDVAWKIASANEYTVWTTDSNGNYTGNLIGAVAGTSAAWVSLEPIFGQGGAANGLTTRVIQTDGPTSLTEVANHYYLFGGSGSGPALKYKGANVTAGEFGAWTPIGAIQTASGYDVAWNNTGTGQYTVWSTDSNGNYKGSLTGSAVSGTSSALESLERVFRQDLNRDGVIGLTTRKLIQTDGSTSLTEVANHYYLYGSSGSGPSLKYNGANVTAGEFGRWTPIGAIQTASRYDVAWKNTSTGQYTVWSTDSNGNYKGFLTGAAVSRTSSALESLEPVFRQDLNRDGVIGLYAAPGTTRQITNALAGTTGSATIGIGATLELTAADSASVTFAGSTGTLRLDHSSTFSGKIFKFSGNGSLSGSDHIDLRDVKYSSVHDSYANGVLTVKDRSGDTAKLSFNGSYTLANFKFANDGNGGTIVYDPPVPSGYNDGSAKAPVGNPQLPNLLSGYSVRPAWQVAGVDYAVGVPTNVTLKDPTVAANLPAGVSIDSTNHVIDITANNVTLNGYDFSLHGGWGINIDPGVTGTTIENCNFSMGSSETVAIMAQSSTVGSLTVVDCNFNGNELNIPSVVPPPAGTGVGSAIQYDGSGTFVAKYNYIHGMPQDGIDMVSGTITPTIEYNLFDGLGWTPGSHPDPVQFDRDVVNNALIAFNTIYQPQGVVPNEGLSLHAMDGATITNSTLANNVIIATDPNMAMSLNVGLFQDSGAALNGVVVTNNYLDPTATYTPTGFGDEASEVGGTNVTITNNNNLLTGSKTAPTAGTFATSDVKSVVASPTSGTEVAGNSLTFKVNFDQAMTVTGTPTLSLNDGGTATYAGGSGTNALTFSYTVGANDSSVSALAITQLNLPNGATIKNSLGDAANISGAATTFSGLQIKRASSAAFVTSIAESPSSGELNAGKTVTLTLNLNEAVTVAGGTPTLTLNDGGTATYSGGSGSKALTFSYKVAAGQNTAGLAVTTINLNSATVKDSASNAASFSLTGLTQSGPQIDTTTPIVSSVVTSGNGITSGSGDLNAGKTVTLTLKLNEAVIVAGGKPTLTLNDGGTASYIGGSGSNALTFSYTVAAGQNTSDLTVTALKLNSATVTDAAGNAANLSGAVTNPAGTLQINTTIGTTRVIQTDGSTSLTEVANHYYLYGSSGSGPALKYKGANVTAGEFGAWTPIGAIQTASGYDVAWKNPGTGQYTVWSTDSNGNYKVFLTGSAVSGTSSALESLEPVFRQDLNRDGVIGLTTKNPSQTGTSTSLVEVANHYYLYGNSRSGPALKYHGANVTAGEFGRWTPIGAIQTTGGYDVAWKNTSTGQYTVWRTDNNGNYKGFLTGAAVSGTSSALESLEPVFRQDLNRDGVIGLYAAPGTTRQITNALAGTSGSATIGTGATLELTAADSASVTFAGSTGTLRLDHSSTFSGKIFKFSGNGSLSGSDHVDLRDVKYSSVHDSYANGVLTVTDGSDTAKLSFNGSYTLANFKFANDGNGGTIVYDPPCTPLSGRNTAPPAPVVPSTTTGTGESVDPTDPPGMAFNVQSMLDYLPDRNQPGGMVAPSEGSHVNIALLGNYMSSAFAMASANHGGVTALAEVAQSNDQSVLSNPHHV